MVTESLRSVSQHLSNSRSHVLLIMGKEDDEEIQVDDEEQLLDKANKKPAPTSVKKTDSGSVLTKEEVKSIVATKFEAG